MALREIRRERRREARYTIREFAELLGVSVGTAYKLDREPERMTYEQAVKTAEWLGCDPKDLF